MASYLIGDMPLTFGTNFHPILRMLLTITHQETFKFLYIKYLFMTLIVTFMYQEIYYFKDNILIY